MKYDTAQLLHYKFLMAKSERENTCELRRKIQIVASGFREAVDAYFVGERPGGTAGHPIHTKITPVAGFSSVLVDAWSRVKRAAICAMLTYLRSATKARCSHEVVVAGSRHSSNLPQLR